jgi:HlyD family secretion protein
VKRILLTTVVVAAVACKGTGTKNDQYRTEKVDRGNVTMTVTSTGTLSAVTTVQVGSQVSGVISRLYADFNSHVAKGQLLAELDPTPFQAQVEQRQADVTKARVESANARITYERSQRLVKAGLSPQADLDAAKAQYEGAQAQVQQATAALQQSLTNLKYTKIVSPIDGVVVDRQYDVGQTVAASFQAPTLFSIAQDLTKMQVQADVDQSDIGRVQMGQPVRFTVDAYPDEEFRGNISQIRLNATVTQNVVSYPVIIAVANPDEKLRPKMTANVTINVATVPDVLRIPNAALRFKPDTGDTATTSTAGGAQRTASASGTASGGNAPAGATPSSAATQGERGMASFGRGRGAAGAAGVLGMRRNAPTEPKKQTVYLLGPDKKPKPAQVRTGITDGHYTQVVDGDVKVADLVIVGLATSKVDTPPPMGQSGGPMGGARPGGAGRRGP